MIARRVPHFNAAFERGKSISKRPESLVVHCEPASRELVFKLRRKVQRKLLMVRSEHINGESLDLSEHWTASGGVVYAD